MPSLSLSMAMMTEQLQYLYKLQKIDLLNACEVLADAFQYDPLLQKIFEIEPEIEQKLLTFYEIPIRYCSKFGEVYATSEHLEGIAGWVPGTFSEMTLVRLFRSGVLMSGMKIGPRLAVRMKPAVVLLDHDRKENMKGTPFIYLQIIGVATQYQGQGYGGKLLRALIEKSELEGLPIYLETQTERNVTLYKRFGFKLVKETILPVIHLPMWEMVKHPQNRY